jgi:hypothetical protein
MAIGGLSAAGVVCRGEIGRTIEADATPPHPALATEILEYHV